MDICIIGWYGTETMGDRAILDGILRVVFGVFNEHCKIRIGSLYPFYTNRTLFEEREIFEESCNDIRKISVFDVMKKEAIEENLRESDLLIFGGGPLMDLEELWIMRYCFKVANEKGIPSIVMGCGVGPLEREQSISLVNDIFQFATRVILRDKYSYNRVMQLNMMEDKISWLGDPAIISAEFYKEKTEKKKKKNNVIAVNFREFPEIEYGKNSFFNEREGFEIIKYLSGIFDEVVLVPMHTFFIGGDDRGFFAGMFSGRILENVKILFRPLNLYGMYETYATAVACLGMRYHSVVMQTILNGNNFIFNYTHNAGEKIDGFLDSIDETKFYVDRVWNMNEKFEIDRLSILTKNIQGNFLSSGMKSEYIYVLNNVLK